MAGYIYKRGNPPGKDSTEEDRIRWRIDVICDPETNPDELEATSRGLAKEVWESPRAVELSKYAIGIIGQKIEGGAPETLIDHALQPVVMDHARLSRRQEAIAALGPHHVEGRPHPIPKQAPPPAALPKQQQALYAILQGPERQGVTDILGAVNQRPSPK